MSLRIHFVLLVLLTCLSSITGQVFAAEEVLLFKADIEIKANRKISITETLKVSVEGENIRQGIVRALPLKMEFPDSPDQTVTYKVHKILRNGKPTKYNPHSNERLFILQIYERGVFLEHKEHTFTINYTVSGYKFNSEMFDTFNWPVTGAGWPLPINRAEAYVKFPPMVLPQNVVASGYTKKGEEDVITRVRGDNIHFTTLDPLTDGGGFSISTTWAKGFFKSGRLLSVPGESQEDVELLSIPNEDGLLEIPGRNQKIQANSLDPDLFTPSAITQYFVDLHVQSNGSVTASESITARFEEGNQVQGLIRNRPLALDSIKPEFAFGASTQLSISSKDQRFFLVTPTPIDAGEHAFTFQYQTPRIVKTGNRFDTMRVVLGDPALKVPIDQIGARIHPPEYMLPNADLVTASIRSNSGQIVASASVDENENHMVVSAGRSLSAGEKLVIEFQIPKGFIKN